MELMSMTDILLAFIYLGAGVVGYFIRSQQKQINNKIDRELLNVELESMSKDILYIRTSLNEVKEDLKYLRDKKGK